MRLPPREFDEFRLGAVQSSVDEVQAGEGVIRLELRRVERNQSFQQSLGTRINVSHLAATPPGLTVTVDVRLDRVEGRKLSFTVSAHDGAEKISEGTHERFVIDHARFAEKVAGKARGAA